MILEDKYCPVCRADIKFSYVVPERSFIILDGKIKRDDAWRGPEYDNPHFIFYCSRDREDKLPGDDEFNKWMEEVEHEVFRQNLSA